MTKGNVLIIDDEAELRDLVSRLLLLESFNVFQAPNAEKGFEILETEDIHVILLDVKLPDANGIELLPKIKLSFPFTEIVMLTAYGTIADGVNAIKHGAFDYITKGDDDDKVVPLITRAVDKAKLSMRLNSLEKKVSSKFSFENITGSSPKILDAVEIAKKVCVSDTTVLLTGETGTGKEIFAQAIHYESSRKTKPFVALNCSAIPKDILESELFGYKAGAFTGAVKNKKGLFEEANEGTLFLDEIAEMDISLQAKLLRVLENNSFIKAGDTKQTVVDVRIIAATNQNLELAIEEKKFRSDLYYRIGVFKIELPSLRERKEDIKELTDYFIKIYSEKLRKSIIKVEDGFYDLLTAYNFPGNIRELKNIIERMVLLSDSGIISSKQLPQEFFKTNSSEPDLLLTMDEVEKKQIIKILELTKNNKPETAKVLNIGLTTLYRKISQYGLE